MMIGHHALIELLLLDFKDTVGKDIELAKKLFQEFRWELEKHIFVEERVIFEPCDQLKSEVCKITMHLVKEHGIMFELLNKAEDDLEAKNKADIAEFHELLTKHRDTEEKMLYPRLDQELTEKEKETIISRINDIPLKKGADAF